MTLEVALQAAVSSENGWSWGGAGAGAVVDCGGAVVCDVPLLMLAVG